MAKRRRSFGSAFLGFLGGLVSFILFLILVVAVGANVLFQKDDSTQRINILSYDVTFFVNNTSDLKNIDEGSLCLIDSTMKPEENTYVLCSIGNEDKRVLCLESITENENGTLSYNVRADRMSALDTVYSIPASKIYGTVYNKDDLIGNIIVFARQKQGIAIMLLAALLLLIVSIGSIRRKKAIYDDDLLEAEMALEDMRKQKRNNEKKAEEQRKLMAEKAAQEAELAMAAQVEARVEAKVREAEAASAEAAPVQNEAPQAPVSDPEPAPFKFEEYKRKTDTASVPAQEPATPVPSPAPVPAAPAPVQNTAPVQTPAENASKYEFTDFNAAPAKENRQEPAAEPVQEPAAEKPVFQEVPLSVRPSYRYENLVQNLTKPSDIKYSEPAEEAPAPAAPVQSAAPVQTPAAPAKKKAKPPVKKLDAESIDDLIRILEEEKKKLD